MSTEIVIQVGHKYLVKQTRPFDEPRKWNSPLAPSIWYSVKETQTCWQFSHCNPQICHLSENGGHYIEKGEIQNIFIFLEDLGGYGEIK